MKYLAGIFLFFALMMSNTAFSQAKKPLPAKKMAKKMCKCMDPLMEMMEKVQSMGDNADEAALMELMQKGKDFDKCIGGMQDFEESMAALPEDESKKYEKDLEAAMKKFCPETLKFFEGNAQSEPSSTEPKIAD